jgi:uncharacterized membrane protein YbaN (DUF454 family)
VKVKIKRTAIFSSGVVLCSVGVFGLLLPVIPGVVFLVIGVYLIAHVIPVLKNKITGSLSRFPKISKIWLAFDLKITKYLPK